MRKIFTPVLIILMFLNTDVISQGKFSASIAATGNVVSFKFRPDVTTSTGFSTIEFFLRYPTTSPVFTYGTVTPNTANFPGMTATGTPASGSWEIQRNVPPYLEAGFNVDHFIYTAPAPVTTTRSYTGGTEYEVISVPLISTGGTVNFQFVHQDTETIYYLAITGPTGNDLRPAAFTNYFYPVTSSSPGPGGGNTLYYQTLNNVSFPLKITSFNAVKNLDNAVLNWTVENESSSNSHFEIERSAQGINFTKVADLPVLANGSATNFYSFTERNISSIKKAGAIYYRLKQVDKDGQFVYSAIRTINLGAKRSLFNLYPNPSKTFTTLTFSMDEPSNVVIKLTDANGKHISVYSFTAAKGITQKRLDISQLAAGSYNVIINTLDNVETLSLIKTH